MPPAVATLPAWVQLLIAANALAAVVNIVLAILGTRERANLARDQTALQRELAATQGKLTSDLANRTADVQREVESARAALARDVQAGQAEATQRIEHLKSWLGEDTHRRLEGFKAELVGEHARRDRQNDYLRTQIDRFYGPVAALVELNDRCFRANADIFRAGAEFAKVYHQGPLTDTGGDQAKKEAEAIVEVANRFINTDVVKNNKLIVALLREHWGLLDEADRPETVKYLDDMTRLDVEFAPDMVRLPPLIYFPQALPVGALKSPSYMRPEFIELCRRRLREKQHELSGLTGPPPPSALPPPEPAPPSVEDQAVSTAGES